MGRRPKSDSLTLKCFLPGCNGIAGQYELCKNHQARYRYALRRGHVQDLDGFEEYWAYKQGVKNGDYA